MRLLHTESSCGWGGQELRVISESRGMMDRGHEVVIAAPGEAPIIGEAKRLGIPVQPLAISRKRPAGWWAMRSFISELRPHLVVTHSSTDSWLASLAMLGHAHAPPLIRMRHVSAPIPANAPTRWLYTRSVAHVVTTGEALRLQVMQQTGLAADRVTSVPTGIDLDRFRPGDRHLARRRLGIPEGAFVVGIVATLRSWKGHRYLVDAVSHLKDAGVWLVMVGDGPGRSHLDEQCRSLGMNQVIMPGNQRNVEEWLQAFDVFVLPSYANEGVPQALMQAMACGLPVLTTPVGAIPEIVTDGSTGLMVTPRNADSLRDGIVRLRDDAGLRERLSLAALERARERFSMERMLDAMERIFARVVPVHA